MNTKQKTARKAGRKKRTDADRLKDANSKLMEDYVAAVEAQSELREALRREQQRAEAYRLDLAPAQQIAAKRAPRVTSALRRHRNYKCKP